MDALPPDMQSLLEGEKLEALAEFAAGAGHELNNPVATIAARAQLLLRDETDPERRRALAVIGGQALRIRDMIGDLMLFARPPEPRPVELDLAGEISGVMETLRDDVEQRRCRLDFAPAGSIPVFADATQLRVVISSLLRNSLEALPDAGGEIAVTCGPAADEISRRALAPGCTESSIEPGASAQRLVTQDMSQFTVADNGRGLSETDRRHLFDPFYSGRQAGRGLGFGLCKCWRIVSNHGGRIDVESHEGRTSFRVLWPAAPANDPMDR
jgi:signal transduction histidine kinase